MVWSIKGERVQRNEVVVETEDGDVRVHPCRVSRYYKDSDNNEDEKEDGNVINRNDRDEEGMMEVRDEAKTPTKAYRGGDISS